jgi:prolycopene isomerase
MRAHAGIQAPSLLQRGSRTHYDAIVIGSGVGGSTTAALLAHAGLDVLVLEKNARIGGILASVTRDGFKLDTGSHLVARGARGPLGRLLRQLGLDRPRFLRHPIPVRSCGMLDIEAPGRRLWLPFTALEAARKLKLPARERLRLGRLLLAIFTMSERELEQWDRRSLDVFLRQYTEHPAAFYLFAFLGSIFFVLPPWDVSAGEAIRCLRWVLRDYSLSYVEGGMESLGNALLGLVTGCGGEVAVQSRAVSIREAGARLQVGTEDGSVYEAPAVACNLAPSDLLGLVDGIELPAAYAEQVKAIRPSGNAHQLRLALRRPLVGSGCLIGGISLSGLGLEDLSLELMERTVATIEAGHVSDPLAVYASVPSNFDATLAPPGAQSIIASIYGPSREDPADPPARWRDRGLEALASVIPGLMDELLFVDFAPVPEIGRWMGKSSRAAICNAQCPGQTGRDRLPVSTPVHGLYLCGDGAGGRGIGIEMAAVSGTEAAEAILRQRRAVS